MGAAALGKALFWPPALRLGALENLDAMVRAARGAWVHEPVPVPACASSASSASSASRTTVAILVANPHLRSPVAVLYLSGNSMDVCTDWPFLQNLADVQGVTAYMVEYLGYGLSRGPRGTMKPSVANMLASCRVAYDYVAARHEAVVVLGSSLGAAGAVHLASRPAAEGPPLPRLRAIVLLCPFVSVLAVGLRRVKGLGPLDTLNNLRKAPHVACPAYILHGDADPLVPLSHGEALWRAMPRCRLYVLRGAGHCQVAPEVLHEILGMALAGTQTQTQGHDPED